MNINNKDGVLSFFSSNENYGQLLQLYASNTILKKLGYDPYVIPFLFSPLYYTHNLHYYRKNYSGGLLFPLFR